jgi:formamidopyrimidine-DNA glycosylase
MPELPEVETIKRQLEKVILGKRITDVIINNAFVIKEPSKEEFKKELKGVVIKDLIRKGKALIFELSNGKFLVVHLRMTGQLVYPGSVDKSRVSFKLSDGKILDFNDRRMLGELRLVQDWREMRFFKELGPEIYDLTSEEFSRMFYGKKTKIKPLLMDQAFISGVGNLYAAEVLFRAKIHPLKSAADLSSQEKKLLYLKIRETLSNAIKHRGSSIDQYVTLTGKKGDYVKFHQVYDREGKPCFVCKVPIKRIALGGRGTYFCGRCQR